MKDMLQLPLAYLLLLSANFLSPMVVARSFNRNAYHSYEFDQTAPVFTPDGRLLQVEYAAHAAHRSNPLVVAAISEDLALVCTFRRKSSSLVLQERILLIPMGSLVDTKTTRNTQQHVVVGLSGFLPDCTSLLEEVQTERMKQYHSHGELLPRDKPAFVADHVARKCHERTLGGGLRPYGASLLICGSSEPRFDNGVWKRSLISFMTDPSGGMPTETLLAEENKTPFLVVGGTAEAKHRINEQLRDYHDNCSGKKLSQKERIAAVLSMVAEQDDGQGILEAALLSSSKGAIKLSQQQVSFYTKRNW